MNLFLLEHDERLGIPPGHAGPLPADWAPPREATVLTFRPPATVWNHGKWIKTKRKEVTRGGLNATSRLLEPFGKHVVCHGLETDSALAPLFLWDVAHALPIDGTITMVGDTGIRPYLGRSYFHAGLAAQETGPDRTVFRKRAILPAERDRGLDRWTFGLPTGPGDATGLNAVIRRILELNVPEFEIILCGKPGPGFHYWDHVRIIGEQYSKPPVYISLKKNLIAEAAQYENICILHDRVFLPLNFVDVVRRFGDLFPIVGFQSIWFDDPWNLIPKRYSDYGRMINPGVLNSVASEDVATEIYQSDLVSAFVPTGCGFIFPSPLRYHQSNYCTGSVYLAKRAVWNACPQDPRLLWSEFEDVEHGLRASAQGIPSRVNPFAFTQSLFARALLLSPDTTYESPNGRLMPSVGFFETVPFRRKPLLKVSIDEATERLHTFARKRIPQHFRDSSWSEFSKRPDETMKWLRQIAVAIYGAKIDFGATSIRELVKDFEKLLMCDVLDSGYRRYVEEHFAAMANKGRDAFVENSPHLSNILFYRPKRNLFYESILDYFPERSHRLRLGTFATAVRLAQHNGKVFYLPDGGTRAYFEAIWNTTPFREYCETAEEKRCA
jgi:hypothetical protein